MVFLFVLMFSVVAIVSAIMVVSLKSIMHCALFLALFLLSISGMFFTLDADFLGIVQILLYVGGVIVLILFAVMLTSRVSSQLLIQSNEQKLASLTVCTVLLIILGYVIVSGGWNGLDKGIVTEGITKNVGELLMTVYVLPFEVASVVLLVALVGTIVLAGKGKEND